MRIWRRPSFQVQPPGGLCGCALHPNLIFEDHKNAGAQAKGAPKGCVPDDGECWISPNNFAHKGQRDTSCILLEIWR